MPSPINTPLTKSASAVTISTAGETTVLVSSAVNTDNLQTQVNVEVTLDVSIGAGVSAIAIQLRRGSGISGSVITAGGTYVTSPVTAATRQTFIAKGVDIPGQVSGQTYTATITATGLTGTTSVNTAILTVTPSAQS